MISQLLKRIDAHHTATGRKPESILVSLVEWRALQGELDAACRVPTAEVLVDDAVAIVDGVPVHLGGFAE